MDRHTRRDIKIIYFRKYTREERDWPVIYSQKIISRIWRKILVVRHSKEKDIETQIENP